MMISAAPAAAHVVVKSSNIEKGGAYGVALGNPVPENLEIAFNSDVGLAELRLETAAGEPVKLDFAKPKAFQASFIVPLPTLTAGAYVFHWRAVAKDGHAMNGKIEFSVE
jgi:methionine-rich copper-binding protein CopC